MGKTWLSSEQEVDGLCWYTGHKQEDQVLGRNTVYDLKYGAIWNSLISHDGETELQREKSSARSNLLLLELNTHTPGQAAA